MGRLARIERLVFVCEPDVKEYEVIMDKLGHVVDITITKIKG